MVHNLFFGNMLGTGYCTLLLAPSVGNGKLPENYKIAIIIFSKKSLYRAPNKRHQRVNCFWRSFEMREISHYVVLQCRVSNHYNITVSSSQVDDRKKN